MEKLDLKKALPLLYSSSAKEAVARDVPAMNFLMIDGEGDPNASASYQEAVQALFAVSYAAKFIVKKSAAAIDYAVMPLEGLWWADDMRSFTVADKAKWKWTMMIAQPDCVSAEIVKIALASAEKKHIDGLSRLRFEAFHEGLCAQILHVGPFTTEGATIARLHAFIASQSTLRGKHHEIYLSDIRRAAPEKWKTIIRQPMQ